MSDYTDLYAYASTFYDEVEGLDFYADLFPNCETSGILNYDFSMPNPLFLYNAGKNVFKIARRVMLEDTFQDEYSKLIENNDLALCSGLSYVGRKNTLEKATRMNALIFDIDSVGLNEFRVMEQRWELDSKTIRSIPEPTYVVLSGSGVHLYYVFQDPIVLFPNIKIQLKSLKYDLTKKIWDYGGTSKQENIQFQSINQAFRMVGSFNNKYSDHRKIVAFKVGDFLTLDYLNDYVVDPQNKVNVNKPFSNTKYSITEAKEKFPEWYQRVIVNGEKKKKKWEIDKKVHGNDPYALYHWWLGKASEVVGGHRYYYLMCLAVYADKCNVPRKKLKKDISAIFKKIASIPHTNKLTKQDMLTAMEAFSKEYYDTTVDTISHWSGIEIKKNKRNGRSMERHLAVARDDKAYKKANGIPFKNPEGRPKGSSKQKDIIRQYKLNHPKAKPVDCIKETKISRNTVYRWWKEF